MKQKAKGVDIKTRHKICCNCRLSLSKEYKNGNIFIKINEMIGKMSNASLDDKSYFDQLSKEHFPIRMGIEKEHFIEIVCMLNNNDCQLSCKLKVIDGLGIYLSELHSGIIIF